MSSPTVRMYTCVILILFGVWYKQSRFSTNVIFSAPLDCTGDDCSTNSTISRTCEPLISPSLAINCLGSRGRGVSCKQRVSPGTKANLFCKEGYQQFEEPGYSQITCEEDGIWDKCPFTCQPICGSSNPISDDSDIGRFPWYATIFRINREGKEPKIACGGTIISDIIILTAAHCVFDGNLNVKLDSSRLKVAVGTGITRWENGSSADAQFYNVKQIIPHPQYKGIALYYRDDIAAVILSEKISFTDYIAPACLDFATNGKITEPTNGTIFTVAGYKNIKGGILESANLPAIPLRECTQQSSEDFVSFLTINKLCAGDADRSEFIGLTGFGGSGVMISKVTAEGPEMHMRGVLSIGSNFQGLFAITDILVYLDWIKQIRTEQDQADKPTFCGRVNTVSKNKYSQCETPPPLANGQYVIGGLAVTPRPGTLVAEWSVIKYSCIDGYGLIGEDTGICVSGQWPIFPTCLKRCKGLTSSSVQLDCVYKGQTVPCDEPVKPGTRAHLQCKRGYKLPYTPDFNSVTCGRDGAWDYSIYRCVADCGIARPKGISLVVNGNDAQFQDFPWHVGIYKKDAQGKYQIWCGGSIITNKMVLTAAHCFFVPGSRSPMSKNIFGVAAGKIFKEWDNPNDNDAQHSELENLIIPEAYDDIHGNYAQDIALIELKITLEFSSLVRPICLEWDFTGVEEEFVAGTKGLVSGWGLTSEGGEVSPNLKYAVLPTVTRQTCLDKSPRDFRPFITADKFCAGYLNGTSVCRGDSGGGLAIPRYNGEDPVYYIRGIVSVGPTQEGTCDSHRYTAFTRVLSHINWLNKYRK